MELTSPAYYGLRTYVADQWLRNWFLGGPAYVDYSYGSTKTPMTTDAVAQVANNTAIELRHCLGYHAMMGQNNVARKGRARRRSLKKGQREAHGM
jgi:hypothetical protein